MRTSMPLYQTRQKGYGLKSVFDQSMVYQRVYLRFRIMCILPSENVAFVPKNKRAWISALRTAAVCSSIKNGVGMSIPEVLT
jgi:hypothetical protein